MDEGGHHGRQGSVNLGPDEGDHHGREGSVNLGPFVGVDLNL